MKNLFKIILLLITGLSFSQINLQFENSYTINSGVGSQQRGFLKAIHTDQGLYYYLERYVSNVGWNIDIYNENHTFYKTFAINNSINNYVQICAVTDKLFNNDNLIEFLILTVNTTVLINDNGLILHTWFDRMYEPKIIKDNNNNYKLIVYNLTGSAPFIITSDVYGLEGTLSLEQQELYLDKSFRAYPNPANNKITISNGKYLVEDTKLEVFDVNGKKVVEKKIMSGEKEIIFDISSYSSGTYIYKINGEAHQFIKN